MPLEIFMRFEIDLGQHEKSHIEFYRNPLTGRMQVTVNDRPVAKKSPWNFFTHFNFEWVKRYEFAAGEKEQCQVVIEHERPSLFGGGRRQKYRVYVDGKLVQ